MAKVVYLGNILCSTKGTPPVQYPKLPPAPTVKPSRPRKSQTIRNVEWFYYLVPHEDALGLVDVVPNYERMFLVCGHFPRPEAKPLKMFAAFGTYLEFVNYIRDVPRDLWNFFEVILGSRPQKFYFDIDLKEDYIPIGQHLESFTERLLTILINRIVETFRNVLQVDFQLEKNLLIFSSHGSGKKSFHLIIDGYCVTNHRENSDLMVEILKNVPREYIDVQTGPKKGKKIIDIGMYSSKQQFRLYGSQKPDNNGPGRPKIFVSEFEHEGKWYRHQFDCPPMSERDRTMFEFTLIFQKSCVTFVDHCQVVTVNKSSDLDESDDVGIWHRPRLWSERGAFDESDRYLTPLAMSQALEIVQSKVNLEVWSIGETQNGMIALRRKRPAHCPICEREHENENAFASVNGKWGQVRFHCWREIDTSGPRKNGFLIGDVESGFLKLVVEQHIESVRRKMFKNPPVVQKIEQPTPPVVQQFEQPVYPFTGSVKKFVVNLATGRTPSYF